MRKCHLYTLNFLSSFDLDILLNVLKAFFLLYLVTGKTSCPPDGKCVLESKRHNSSNVTHDKKALIGFIDFVIKFTLDDVRRVLFDNVSKQPLKRINIIQRITGNIISNIFA